MQELPNRDMLGNDYKDRTNSDINEELLVSEFSKYVTGENSVLSSLSEPTLQKIMYNVTRVLDSILFGKQSVNTINPSELFNSSLVDLSKYLGSSLINNQYSGSLDVNSAEVHRILANVKSDLMKSNDLKEFCGV